MKDHHFLMDAMGQIDDDLIREAAQPGKKTFPRGLLISAIAACLAIAIGCSLLLWPGHQHGSTPSIQSSGESETQTLFDPSLKIMDNLWQRDGFQAYSLSYQTGEPTRLSCFSPTLLANSTDAIATKTLSISSDMTMKFEILVAHRYAVFYSDTGYPVFYDTQEDRQVDLQERILGDTNHIFITHAQAAEAYAVSTYPGIFSTEKNRQLFWEYLYGISRNLDLQDVVSRTPDTEFINAIYDRDDIDQEQKNSEFWSMCWSAYCHADTDLYSQLYNITILGIDAAGGLCILRANDLYGNGCAYLLYDIKTDTCTELPDGDSLQGTMQTDGYLFYFSADSSIATIAYPDAYCNGGNLYQNLTQRFTIPSVDRYVNNYQGEDLGVFFLEDGRAQKLNNAKAASLLYASPNNSVLYYKKMDAAWAGKSFYASDAVWYNRLNLYNKDTDQWIFHTVTDQAVSYGSITLQGNFVRFAAEESVVIMERGGVYYAYSLTDGSDITQSVKNGEVAMYAHEQIITWLENGKLYRKNMFTESEPQVICDTTQYALSQDQAFVFVYQQGQQNVVCYNVASLESCKISMDAQLFDQMLSMNGAVLQMNYNAEENTLLLSYFVESDLNTENTSNVDFFQTLGQIRERNPDGSDIYEPVTVTDITISEEIMDQFRESVERYYNCGGYITWERYYPDILDLYESKDSICRKLGIEISIDDLDINGTRFVLYDKNGEMLTLNFYHSWGLFDYNDQTAGFYITYNDDQIVYSFVALEAKETTPDEDDRFDLPFEIPPLRVS